MDIRNFGFKKLIEPDRAIRVVSSPYAKKFPTPSFFRTVEQDWWTPGDMPAGVVYVGSRAGTNVTIRSYHPESDTYYGNVGTRVARQPAEQLGVENSHELGPDFGAGSSPNYVYRTDAEDDTPKFICFNAGKMYFWEGDFATGTPTETLDFSDYGGATIGFSTNIDMDGYGRVWIGQYAGSKAGEPWRVFMSADFGATWDVIFYGPDLIENFDTENPSLHIHAVRYDPFDDLLFVTTGDGGRFNQTYVTQDNGANWYRLFPDQSIRFTETMTFPEHVVLGSDDSGFRGMAMVPKGMLWEKPFRGERLDYSDVYLDAQYNIPGSTAVFYTQSNQVGLSRIGKRHTLETYVGYVAHPNQFALFGSPDGYYWFELWRQFHPGQETSGIRSLFGPDSNGIIWGQISAPGYPYSRMAFKKPEWK